jgi:hypothetical protein
VPAFEAAERRAQAETRWSWRPSYGGPTGPSRPAARLGEKVWRSISIAHKTQRQRQPFAAGHRLFRGHCVVSFRWFFAATALGRGRRPEH